MNNKLFLVMSTLSLTVSLALAQTDEATTTVINDETQARLRVNYCVFGGPSVDIFVNGEVAVNGGVPQTNVPVLATWGYLYLDPNTYSVAVVPTGEELNQALMGPIDVTVEAGHRYTVVVLGQADEDTHQPLVIDETEAYEAIGAMPTDTAHITVNNLRGIAGITWTLAGEVREDNIPYGEFQAALWPSGTFTGFETTFRQAETDNTDTGSVSDEMFYAPGTDSLDCYGGTPSTASVMETELQDWANLSSWLSSTLSAVDSLKLRGNFSTYLNALETTGLSKTLANGNAYMLYVPTDEAFATLPKDQLDALLADPQAMTELLRYHIVEGYYPYGTLPGWQTPGQQVVTNLQGTDLEIHDDGTVNGVAVEQIDSLFARNGTYVRMISQVLMPPE